MTLKDLQDKKFKWDWSHDYYYSDEFILNIKFRKCNHCGTSLCNNGKLPNLKKETNPIQMSWFDGMEY